MESLIGGGNIEKKTFMNHMFSLNEENKAEYMNIIQYAVIGFIPVIILNKSVQYIFPDVDFEKSSFFILAEIFLQIFFIFFAILFIHRFISFFNSFSGFKFDNISFSNIILPFFIIIFSIHSKLANKINLLFFRTSALWNGTDTKDSKAKVRSYNNTNSGGTSGGNHTPSQADYLDNSTMQTNIFPPAPVASKSSDIYQSMQNPQQNTMESFGPIAANSMLGGSFGSAF
jgi:hypothetical protein